MMVMPSRSPTAYDDKIYSADWRAFVDPEVPETIAPTAILLDRHLGTPVEHKAAVIVDGEPVSYGALARCVAEVSAGLCAIGVVPENRILLFGTDSLDYVTMWLGTIRVGAVPAAVSDLYKAPDLAYFIRDTAARFLFIDAEQLGKLAEIAAALPASLETVIVRGDAMLGAEAARQEDRLVPDDCGWRRARRRGLPAPSKRRDLHVLFRRDHRHRQGHHPSRP